MTIIIIIITVIISIVAFNNHTVMSRFIFNPYLIKVNNEWHRFVTSGLLHGDYFHLIINMLVLFSFGQAVETMFMIHFPEKYRFLFLSLYIGSLIVSSISTYYKHQNNSWYNSLGASGAVSAIVFSSIIFNPLQKIYLYGLIGIHGIIAGPLYLVYSWWMAKNRPEDHINHDAHFYGAVFGVLFTILAKPSLIQDFLIQLFN